MSILTHYVLHKWHTLPLSVCLFHIVSIIRSFFLSLVLLMPHPHDTIVMYNCLLWCIQLSHSCHQDVLPHYWANHKQEPCPWDNITYARINNHMQLLYHVISHSSCYSIKPPHSTLHQTSFHSPCLHKKECMIPY